MKGEDAMAFLELKNIYKSYYLDKEEFPVLKGINLQFDRGEFVSILGESGGGKSTLMNIIGGLDRNFEGEVLVNGKILDHKKEKQLDSYRRATVGYIYQSYNLISHLTVLDNVLVALDMTTLTKEERRKRALELLDKVGLSEQVKKHPNHLSGGQKQRVAIARALASDPQIIFTEAEEASEIVGQAAGNGVNIWLGTSIDDTLKDEIRVTVVATGVRQDRAEKVSGMKAQPRKVTTAPSQSSVPNQQVAQEQQRLGSQASFERQPNFDYNETHSMSQPGVRPTVAAPQQEQSAFGNWDLKRDNISRPKTGELDSQLTMSTFSSDVEDDDELETPPFFKNR